MSRLFTSPEIVSKSFDMVRDGLDKSILTDEERLDYNKEAVAQFIEFMRIASDGGHLARRFIGLMVTGVWSIYASTIGLLFVLGVWNPAFAEAAVGLTEVMLKIVLPSFGGVMLFYFGHRLVK